MATICVADSPWHTRIILGGGEGVVLSLAMRVTDGMDGWDIEDIETHLRNRR